jgi:hypothetical protein
MALPDRALAHPLRFARTLALVSSLGASAAGCYDVHRVVSDAGPTDSNASPDSALADAGHDAGLTCETCSCSWTTPPPETSCESAGLSWCCAAVGPLAPPDLAV